MPVSEPTWKAQPQGPEYDAVRQRIIDAAEHLIRDGGVGALRQDAVAARAGLARSSVYRYFDSKEELVTAAVVQSTLRIGAQVQAAIGTDADPERLLVQGIIDALEAMAADPLLHALTVPTSSRAMTKLANSALREGVRPLLEPVFVAAAERGVLRPGVSVDDALRWLQVVSLGLMQAPSVVADLDALEDLLHLMLVPVLIERGTP
jgi:AcrR family transcriptional regulator